MKIFSFISWTKNEYNVRYKLNVKARTLKHAKAIAIRLMDNPVFNGQKPI